MATKGDANWKRHWQNSDKQSVIKEKKVYYTKTPEGKYIPSSTLAREDITYVDSLTTTHTRAAFYFLNNPQQIFYTNIDNLVKPGTLSNINLSPEAFGIAGTTLRLSDYIKTVLRYIISNEKTLNVSGELSDYLYELVSNAKSNTMYFGNIDKKGFPWLNIEKQFVEVLAPIYCLSNKNILNIPSNEISTAYIEMPVSSTGLYDFKIVTNVRDYVVSTKGGTRNTNQVKPQFVVPTIKKNVGTLGYNVLVELTRPVKIGSLYAWNVIANRPSATSNQLGIPQAAIDDMQTNYTSSSKRVFENLNQMFAKPYWDLFIQKYFPQRNKLFITYGEIRYKCEKLIEDESKKIYLNNDLKAIFSEYLSSSEIFYISLKLNTQTGVPRYQVPVRSNNISRLYLRTSNNAARTADRMGFQIG